MTRPLGLKRTTNKRLTAEKFRKYTIIQYVAKSYLLLQLKNLSREMKKRKNGNTNSQIKKERLMFTSQSDAILYSHVSRQRKHQKKKKRK